MEEIIILVLQGLIEFVVEVILYMPLDWTVSARATSMDEDFSNLPVAFLFLVVGAAVGGLSLLIWPHTLMHVPAQRIANLVLAPVAAGTLSYVRAVGRAKKSGVPLRYTHFWSAFSFTLAVVVIRFAYAGR